MKFLILALLVSCATTQMKKTKEVSYVDQMRNSKDIDKIEQKIDIKIPLIWYVEKF